MLWITIVFSSIWIGYTLIPFFRVNDLNFYSRIFTGWLIGSSITSFAVYILNFVLPMGPFLVLVILAAEVFAIVYLQKTGHKSPYSHEKSPWYYFFIIFTAGVSLKHLSRVYNEVPNLCHSSLMPIMDRELSFINSVLYGVNKRRSNLFFYSDPMVYGSKFYGYAMPLLFTSVLMSGGLSYGGASIVICFINTIATSFAIYQFAKKYTKWPTLASFVFIYLGGWASVLFMRASHRIDKHNDLVHLLSKTHETVMYQPLAHILSLSKSVSFAFTFAQFAILWQPSILSYVLAALSPSIATSIATFGLLAGMPHSVSHLIPFASTILFRLYPFTLNYKPLFREAEMRGTFFAPVVIWFIALGPIFIVLAGFSWYLPRNKFKFYFIASAGPFLLLNFFREGTGLFANSAAIAATFLPLAVVAFTELLRKYIDWPTDEEYKGCALFIATFTFGIIIAGGLICTKRLGESKEQAIGPYEIEAAKWLHEIVPYSEPILTKSTKLNPTTLTGHQQYLGDKAELFADGVNLKPKLDEIYSLIDASAKKSEWKALGIKYVLQNNQEPLNIPVEHQVLKENNMYSLLEIKD